LPLLLSLKENSRGDFVVKIHETNVVKAELIAGDQLEDCGKETFVDQDKMRFDLSQGSTVVCEKGRQISGPDLHTAEN
jgi:hypothetical protein